MAIVGVVVGRFQVDKPHVGHLSLLKRVRKKHNKVLICLGCAPARLLKTDPLDYATRAKMMQKYFPWATIVPLHDQPSDELWSVNLDRLIGELFPTDTAILYGSRKSFLKHYNGKWPIEELDELHILSATELRTEISEKIRDSEDFRAGIIYACANRYDISYPVVDVAVLKYPDAKNINPGAIEVLMCRKHSDISSQYNFIGGFVDTSDENFEDAAKREVMEETGLGVENCQYLGSAKIDDWRYRGRGDRMVSSFFKARYIFGAPKAVDDIVEVRWIQLQTLQKLPELIGVHHHVLAEMLFKNLNLK